MISAKVDRKDGIPRARRKHPGNPGRAVIFLSVLGLLLPSGCIPRGPTLYERSPHVVAVVIADASMAGGVRGMPAGRGDGASTTAGSAVKDLWSGCRQGVNGASGGAVIVITVLCVGLTPFFAIGGAVAGAAGASSKGDVDRAKQGLEQHLADRDRIMALFEQKLYAEQKGIEGHFFKSGKDFGLDAGRPEGDYRDLAAKGADAVLEIDRFMVALSGKNLKAGLALKVCATVKLTHTLDNAVLYQAERCENGESTRSLEGWSADGWAAVEPEMEEATGRLATNLAWYIFHGNKETIAAGPAAGQRQGQWQ